MASQQVRDPPHPHFRLTTLRRTALSGNSTVPSATPWLVKACEGDTSSGARLLPLVFWADYATTRKSGGYSPFMAHGIEPVLSTAEIIVSLRSDSSNASTRTRSRTPTSNRVSSSSCATPLPTWSWDTRQSQDTGPSPTAVIGGSHNGTYDLAEIDGAVSRLHYDVFQLILYFSCLHTSIPVTRLLDREELAAVV